MPQTMPNDMKSRKNFIGAALIAVAISKFGKVITAGKVSGVAVIVSKTGRTPKTVLTIKDAVTAAVTVGISISDENLLRNSSMQKITPANGALKIAARPAPAPAVSKKFPSTTA